MHQHPPFFSRNTYVPFAIDWEQTPVALIYTKDRFQPLSPETKKKLQKASSLHIKFNQHFVLGSLSWLKNIGILDRITRITLASLNSLSFLSTWKSHYSYYPLIKLERIIINIPQELTDQCTAIDPSFFKYAPQKEITIETDPLIFPIDQKESAHEHLKTPTKETLIINEQEFQCNQCFSVLIDRIANNYLTDLTVKLPTSFDRSKLKKLKTALTRSESICLRISQQTSKKTTYRENNFIILYRPTKCNDQERRTLIETAQKRSLFLLPETAMRFSSFSKRRIPVPISQKSKEKNKLCKEWWNKSGSP